MSFKDWFWKIIDKLFPPKFHFNVVESEEVEIEGLEGPCEIKRVIEIRSEEDLVKYFGKPKLDEFVYSEEPKKLYVTRVQPDYDDEDDEDLPKRHKPEDKKGPVGSFKKKFFQ